MNADKNQFSFPKTVSRYFRNEDYAYDSFTNGQMWVSNVTDFNDPFDVLPAFGNVAAKIITQQQKIHFAFTSPKDADWNKYQEWTQAETEQTSREATELGPHLLKAHFTNKNGVVCFSARSNSIVMWAHYASNHQGFVLEFEVSYQFFAPPFFRRVDYPKTDARPRAEDPDRLRTVSTKSISWENEEEFRLILPRESLKRLDGKPGHYVDLPVEAIRAVYFGCRMSPARREQLLKILEHPKYKRVLTFQMLPDPNHYRLIPETWSDSVREKSDFLFRLECVAKEALNSRDFSAALQDLLGKRFQK